MTDALDKPGHPAIAPLAIGDLAISPPLVLAPMSGVTDVAMRLLCREMGAGLVCNEFISGYGLFHGNRKTMDMLLFDPAERPVSSQIFGSDPAKMAIAARQVEEAGADILDLNLGCSVKKIVSNGAGACLLQTPRTIHAIVAAMVAAVRIPVTVKIRLGWDDQHRNAVEVVRAAEEAGARAVAVHGRTASQAYRGVADWDAIGEAKAAAGVPIIGNGDVRTPEDALRMLRHTGCDGVMIGRAAQGNPWIFARARAVLAAGRLPPEPTVDERIDMALRHGRLMLHYKGARLTGLAMRRHVCWYCHGLPQASLWRDRFCRAADWRRMTELLEAYRAELRRETELRA